MTDPTLSLLVHAGAKIGKTTLTTTAPLPLCVIDAEGGWRFIQQVGFQSGIPLRIKHWDPVRSAPPEYDGTWDACVATVRDWQTVQMTYQHLTQSPHQFKSLVVDSITEVQRRLKRNLRGTDTMQMQDWGQLLTRMDAIIRDMRDLILLQSNVRVVVFVAETRLTNGKWTPYMQGQISVALPYMVDVVGYLYVENENDANNQPTIPMRKLLVGPHPLFETGERVQGTLPGVIKNPHIGQIVNTVFNIETIKQVTSAADMTAVTLPPVDEKREEL